MIAMIIKGFVKLVLSVLLLLTTVIVGRTLMFTPQPLSDAASQTASLPAIATDQLAARLSAAIGFQTISFDDRSQIDYQEFSDFQHWLEQVYPVLHQQLEKIVINQHTLLFRWPAPSEQAGSILLSAHYDVVPVEPGTEAQWQHPPFAGTIADGYVWGRGALDNKGAAIAMLEAVNLLLASGYQPAKDIYLALTHDEEIGSTEGAQGIVHYFRQHGIYPEWSLDEGSFVLQGIIPGISEPVASINIAEKGYLTLQLIAKGEGGHSSLPPPETAVKILAAALVKLHYAPLPGQLDGLSAAMYDSLARHMPLRYRVLFANRWLFGRLLESTLSESAVGNAMLRTTTAPTMLSGSVKPNVLPITATATINFRIHPRDSVAEVVSWVRQAIDDERIQIRLVQQSEPSGVASQQSEAFRHLASSVQQVHGPAIVIPGLTVAATDSRYYESGVKNAYRFNPMLLRQADLAGFHGTNERISIDNLEKAVQFYMLLLQASN